MGAGEMYADVRTPEPFDRLPIETLGVIPVRKGCARAGLDPERPVGAAGAGRLGDQLERSARELRLSGPDGRLDQLGQRPERRALLVAALGLADRGQGRITAEPVNRELRSDAR